MNSKKIFEYSFLWLFGGAIYYFIEIAYRGYSHWTMYILGGICLIVIGLINEIFPWELSLLYQMIIGGIIVTILEFIFGCIFNLGFHMNIWDYSDVPYNILGQICLSFTFAWMLLSGIAIIIDDYIRYWLFDEEKPHYHIL